MNADVTAAGPLAGRVILVTRAREQAGRFAALLEEAGGRVLQVPTIVIEAPPSWAPLDDALRRARQYRWAIFTSVNGVEMVRRRLADSGRDSATLAGCRIAAIGPATAEALADWGLAAEVVPEEYVAERLADRLRPLIGAGDRVLLPRAAETRDVLVRELRAMGAVVDEVAAYRTRSALEQRAGLRAALGTGVVNIVTFTSSSTVRHFAALFEPDELRSLMSRVTVACIGPITRATTQELGLDAHIMPTEYTIPALARAIVAHFEEQRS
ncbi:MAG TPA: uroporphyrinogen-III synthase [Methylomirabilota bacterium]|nr:uroporphyrinogen-III synthase [Methylomirabilota bacterium]